MLKTLYFSTFFKKVKEKYKEAQYLQSCDKNLVMPDNYSVSN